MSTLTISIACALIDPPKHARKIKKSKFDQLKASIRDHGILQPPGVIAVGDRYRIIWGHTRFKSWVSLGHENIDVRVLSSDTTPGQELEYSLNENHVRDDEDYEDTLFRVEQYAAVKNCSIGAAAKAGGVSSSFVSKAKTIGKALCDDAKRIAKEKKVGISVLYGITKAKTDAEQVSLLNDYLSGKIDRAGIDSAVKKSKPISPKRISFNVVYEPIALKLSLLATATYQQVFAALGELKKDLVTREKNRIPVKLLPEVLQPKGT